MQFLELAQFSSKFAKINAFSKKISMEQPAGKGGHMFKKYFNKIALTYYHVHMIFFPF